MYTQKTISILERIFWVLAGVPIGMLMADKVAYVGGSLFPNWAGFFWWLGALTSLAGTILCMVLRPLCRFFCKRTALLLVFGTLIFGIICGISFGDMTAFLGHSPYLEYPLYRYACALGSGFALAIMITLLAVSIFSYFKKTYKVQGNIINPIPTTINRTALLWGVAVLVFCGTALFLATSRTLYYWDNTIYHNLSRMLEREIVAQPLSLFEQVYYTIQTWDYNYLGALLPTIFMYFFGPSRGVFIVACMGLYLLSALFMYYFVNRRICRSLNASQYNGMIFLGIVLGFPLLPFLTLNGSIDVGGVALMLLCCYLYFDEERPYLPRYLLCGALLLLLVLFRRWYIFWGVAFLIVAVIDRFACVLQERKRDGIKNWFLRMTALFGSFGMPFILFFDKLLVDKYLLSSVVSAYQAYVQGLEQNMFIFGGYFGEALLVLAFACAICNLFNQKTRRITLFLAVQAVLCFCLLSIVQSHDIQHLLLYAPFLLYSLSFGIANFCTHIKRAWFRRAVCAVLAVCVVLNFSNVLHPGNKILGFAQFDMQLTHSEQVGDLLELLYCLDRETEQSEGKAVVLAASDLLNMEKLSYAEISLNLSDYERDYFLNYSTVDRRDGFSDDIFEAELVVVPSVPQAYLGEDNMRVIIVPTQYFYENRGFARAFERLEAEYALGGGVSAVVYKKVREITLKERAELQNELASYYPDLPELFPTM